MTVDPLATLATDRLYLDRVENAWVAPQQEQTLFSKNGPGVVKSLWMALGGGNNPTLDGRIRIYYDGNPVPSMDIDVGTLFATHWGAGSAYGSLNTPHMHVEIQPSTLNTGLLMTFPAPFGQSIRITYYNPSPPTKQTAYVYSMVTYNLTPTDTAQGKRLRCQGARVLDQLRTRQAGDVTTFATIQGGPGSIVYMAYVAGVDAAVVTPNPGYSGNDSWMERNITIAVDGETPASIQATGTEDWFDSAWYYEGWKDFNTSIHSYVGTDKPGFQPHCVGVVTDLWSKWGGVPFGSSALMQALTESACTTGDRYAYAVLYYQ